MDDGSVDETAAVAAAAGCEVVRLPTRMGICVARNAGAARAHGEILAFVDDDAEVLPGWAAALRRAFAEGPALVGGGIRVPPPRSLAEWYCRSHEQQDTSGRNGFLPFVCGANFSIQTEVFRRLEGFDEALPSSEDLDLSFRAQLADYPVSFAPRAEVIHRPRGSITAMLRQRAHHSHGDRVVSHKYREFPFQRAKLWRRGPIRVLFIQTAGQLMTGVGGQWRRLLFPTISSAAVIADWLGFLKGDFELFTGRRPQPEAIQGVNVAKRSTATELQDRPSVLILGDDRLAARLLRITFEAGGDLSVAPWGLADEAVARWDEPAPAYSDLARLARRSGWFTPSTLAAARLAREQPQTWGEAFCTLHATEAWLLRRPRFGLLALGDAGVLLAQRFPELPIVALGRNAVPANRVIFRLTRRSLLRDRKRVVAELRRALRNQVPATTSRVLAGRDR